MYVDTLSYELLYVTLPYSSVCMFVYVWWEHFPSIVGCCVSPWPFDLSCMESLERKCDSVTVGCLFLCTERVANINSQAGVPRLLWAFWVNDLSCLPHHLLYSPTPFIIIRLSPRPLLQTGCAGTWNSSLTEPAGVICWWQRNWFDMRILDYPCACLD